MKKSILIASLIIAMISALGMLVTAYPITNTEAVGINLEAKSMGLLAMSLSIIGACIAAGYALASTCAAAIGAVAEKPELFSITFIYVVFCEALAIYGLMVAFMIAAMI